MFFILCSLWLNTLLRQHLLLFVIGETDPQSLENSAFNKGMLKQVQHDGGIFRTPQQQKSGKP
jgi:hypothetical protein